MPVSKSSKPATPSKHYENAARISHSFVAQPFRPSWFASNPHFQTIVGTLFRKETMYSSQFFNVTEKLSSFSLSKNKLPFQWDRRERVETLDGDFFHVDWKFHPRSLSTEGSTTSVSSAPIVLICHGLETNSNSPLCQEMAVAFNKQRMDAACINFRGCSGVRNLTSKGYHVGYTDDLLWQIQLLNQQYPQRRIYLAGFSLGAGVVTKLLTELQDEACKFNIAGAAVNAVPFDLTQSSASLNEDGFAKRVYGDRILKSMKQRLYQQYEMCDFPFDRAEIDRCQTIMDVENLVIASTFGFDDAWDYYDKCKTIDKLDLVCVPQYIIQSLDDPFFEGMQYPDNNPEIPIHIHYTEFGGHCGYIFKQVTQASNDEMELSWMPVQLARFLAHVEANMSGGDNQQTKNGATSFTTDALVVPTKR
ncbi:alpha/beta-hydrolase fold protein [Nitzschia inconspicua]|uniref:Alpha/beta-hydrolase fold protein n=1 Tax=Nitzschia inconspicua TaxID=303405 RepID=A0A9K3KQS2_9STRA|nr:alpha/beta-hydrolase fold protein [Nitzschia inconspicua]